MAGAEPSEGGESYGGISNQLASLVPSFDPSKDELQVYQQKVELLVGAWPPTKIKELVTRLILNCQGSAFQKLQLHQSELLVNDIKGVHRLIELLGGHWGKIGLERKFEDAERALFQTVQKSDESNDSYLARADILWARLMSRKMKLEELQAYILLRGSLLSPEEKKKVIIDSDNSLEGELTIKRVSESIRMLGAGFFQEMTGAKRGQKLKIYDQTTLLTMDTTEGEETLAMQHGTDGTDDQMTEDDFVEQMAWDGEDQDAVLVTDFENAATEVLQNDTELSMAYSAYTEARKRLSDKFKSRGFWPPTSPWKPTGIKGKGKQKGKTKHRKSLQERILSSYCKACNRKGHWKAECPYRQGDGNSSGSHAGGGVNAAPTSTVVASSEKGLPMEFLNLPVNLPTLDEPCPQVEFNFGTVSCDLEYGLGIAKRCLHDSFLQCTRSQNEKLGSHQSIARSELKTLKPPPEKLREEPCELRNPRKDAGPVVPHVVSRKEHEMGQSADWMLFATHGTFGVVDSGATKTVIGSSFVADLLRGLDPEVRKRVTRSECHVTFRFGNHGTLTSKHAIVVPIGRLMLQIAIVDGLTPFLISNTLLRALKAKIDCENDQLLSRSLSRPVPLVLTERGLYLADLNDLVLAAGKHEGETASTFVTEQTNQPNMTQPKEDDAPIAQPQQNSAEEPLKLEPSKMKPLKVSEVQSQSTLKGCPETDCSENFRTQLRSQEVDSDSDRISSGPCDFPNHGSRSFVASQEPPIDTGEPGSRSRSSARDPAVHVSTDHGGLLGFQDSVRQCTQGGALRDRLEGRSELGELAGGPLQQEQEVRASTLSEICRVEGRAGRDQSGDRAKESSPTEFRQSSAQESCHAETQIASGQMQDDRKTTNERRSTIGGGLFLSGPRRSRIDHRAVCLADYGKPPNASARERHGDHEQSDAPSRDSPRSSDWSFAAAKCLDCPAIEHRWELDSIQHAMFAGELDPPEELKSNPETDRCRKLIHQISQELLEVIQNHKLVHESLDLLEVFCSDQSQLTQQVRNLAGTAERHGLNQGDLMSKDGRRRLFIKLVTCRPEHVWFSPICGPWSAWTALNESRSIANFDYYHQKRLEMCSQVALGIVLYRHQMSHGKHFSWEQPGKSTMFRMPSMNEVFQHLQAAEFDMCRVGELKDPRNQKFMKKSMTVLTSSEKIFQSLHGRKCTGTHVHQPLEGTTVEKGKVMNRTQFSENYPRKFARQIANIIIRKCFPPEKPLNYCSRMRQPQNEADAMPSEGISLKVPSRPKLNNVAALEEIPEGNSVPLKKIRVEGKQPVNVAEPRNMAKLMFEKLDQTLPRVGKVEIHDANILQLLRQVCPGKEIVKAIACRGTERTFAPPVSITKHEAPFRRAVVWLRGTGKIQREVSWEDWSSLAQRQIIRKGHSCRINITAFGCNPPGRPEESFRSADTKPRPAEATDEIQENPKPESCQPPDVAEPRSKCQHGVRFLALPKDEQQMLIRMHKNLGHPSNERLSLTLSQQQYHATLTQGVLDLHCEVCTQSGKPKHARPAVLKNALEFNSRLYVDGVKWTNHQGTMFHFYHVIDAGSNYHVAFSAPNRSSSNAIELLMSNWINWAGPPVEMTFDSATEFNSEEFQEFLQRLNIKRNTISPESHWQLGKAERHGSVLQNMLDKIDMEMPIITYVDLQKALIQCTHAKNSLSVRRGYTPELIVFGKQSRLPGSICGDELVPAHSFCELENQSMSSEEFRQSLQLREKARMAFHHADNNMAIRRAILRRSCPDRGSYEAGEWIMCWRSDIGGGKWIGPQKVILQDGTQTIWSTMSGKLFRSAPENVRPITSSETKNVPRLEDQPDDTEMADQIQRMAMMEANNLPTANHDDPNQIEIPDEERPEIIHDDSVMNPNTNQPDYEPSPAESERSQQSSEDLNEHLQEEAENPENQETLQFLCVEEPSLLTTTPENSAWRVEFECSIPSHFQTRDPTEVEAWTLLATQSKKQRSEVRLSSLSPEEMKEFDLAKHKEVQNWLQTGTIARILKNQIPEEQILRCRWILTWKPLDAVDQESVLKETGKRKTHKAKARLVVLGYLDPKIDEIPRDSPTLSRPSRMLLLQMISSMGWSLQSFDIKAAFLQGKPQSDRIIGIHPVPEISKAMKLGPNEVCYLQKGAYGLIDAPFQWYMALHAELTALRFIQSPFDPCLYVLWSEHPQEQDKPIGILGIHVDDGLCGGNGEFQEVLKKLEQKFPFGSKRTTSFTFTGIELTQKGDSSIELSQGKYVGKIPPIAIEANRRTCIKEAVNEEERQALRGLVGSLQYAAVNTRPDMSSKLSQLQSSINTATVETLLEANKTLHEAKRHQDVTITIKPIPLKDFCFMVFSDASFASAKRPDSHAGMIIVGTHKDIVQNISCPISPLAWGSRKIQKVVTSTLSAETHSMSAALDQLSWIRLYWGWLLNSRLVWKEPERALSLLPCAVAAGTKSEKSDVAVTDCKSLFDLTTRTAVPACAEFRVALQARAIKELLSEGIDLRWVHTGAQLADALTKAMQACFLRETLRIGRYHLTDEFALLKARATERDRVKWLKQDASQSQK